MATKMVVCYDTFGDLRDITRSLNSLFRNSNVRVSNDDKNIYLYGKDIEKYYEQVRHVYYREKMKIHDMKLHNVMRMQALVDEKRVNPSKSFYTSDECFYDGSSKRNFLIYVKEKYKNMLEFNKELNEYDKLMIKLLDEFKKAGNSYLVDKSYLPLLKEMLRIEKLVINGHGVSSEDKLVIKKARKLLNSNIYDSYIVNKIINVVNDIDNYVKLKSDEFDYLMMLNMFLEMQRSGNYKITDYSKYLYLWHKVSLKASSYYEKNKENITEYECKAFEIMAYIENMKKSLSQDNILIR